MLGDAERPADHRAMAPGVGMRHITDNAGRNGRLALGVLEGVGLDAAPVFVETRGCVVNEFLVFQARRNDFTGYGIRQRDVGPDIETSPHIRPLSGTRSAWIDGIQARSVPHAL